MFLICRLVIVISLFFLLHLVRRETLVYFLCTWGRLYAFNDIFWLLTKKTFLLDKALHGYLNVHKPVRQASMPY
jgi:hypothetical protein